MSHLKIFFVTMAILCFVGSSINPRTGAQSNSVSENEFEFVGRIMNLPNTTGFIGDWTVGSRIVHVTTATGIDQEDGAVAVGALVEAKGTLRADGSVDATRIEVKQAATQCFEFRGIIQSLPSTAGFIGDWMVAGTVIHVTSATLINTEEGAVAVGKLVQIEGCRRVDGTIDAAGIEVEEAQRPDCLEFEGVIESLPPSGLIGDWKVSGRIIHVTADTLIKIESGAVVPGAFVEIEGCPRTDGSIDAGKIGVEREEEATPLFPFVIFFGTVQTLPPSPFTGDWFVNGRKVHVNGSTQIDKPTLLSAGSFVRVFGGLRSDGSVDAVRIEVQQPNDFNNKNNFFELFGVVQSMPPSGVVGDWVISNITVHVSSATQFNAEHGHRISIGSKVVVVGTQRTDLSLDAIRIHRRLEVDDAEDFMTQQYHDFLNREPDEEGLQFYLNILSGCHAGDTECTKYTRGALSGNFFRSPEFQQKGSFVMYLYMVSLGQRPATVGELSDATKVERPHYAEFLTDLQSISDPTDNKAAVSARKDALTIAWLQRREIQQRLPDSLSNDQFVKKLESTSGVNLANEKALIASLNDGSRTRAQVLRAFVESSEVNKKFYKQGFVTMEYFGYLRRDPETCTGSSDPANCGFIFHNNRFNLDADPDLIQNFIVRGFIESPEYRGRFGPN